MSSADGFPIYNISKKNFLIFISVSILAIHTLIFLTTFKINYPCAADNSDVFKSIFSLLDSVDLRIDCIVNSLP